jgi:hypothetical protein
VDGRNGGDEGKGDELVVFHAHFDLSE